MFSASYWLSIDGWYVRMLCTSSDISSNIGLIAFCFHIGIVQATPSPPSQWMNKDTPSLPTHWMIEDTPFPPTHQMNEDIPSLPSQWMNEDTPSPPSQWMNEVTPSPPPQWILHPMFKRSFTIFPNENRV